MPRTLLATKKMSPGAGDGQSAHPSGRRGGGFGVPPVADRQGTAPQASTAPASPPHLQIMRAEGESTFAVRFEARGGRARFLLAEASCDPWFLDDDILFCATCTDILGARLEHRPSHTVEVSTWRVWAGGEPDLMRLQPGVWHEISPLPVPPQALPSRLIDGVPLLTTPQGQPLKSRLVFAEGRVYYRTLAQVRICPETCDDEDWTPDDCDLVGEACPRALTADAETVQRDALEAWRSGAPAHVVRDLVRWSFQLGEDTASEPPPAEAEPLVEPQPEQAPPAESPVTMVNLLEQVADALEYLFVPGEPAEGSGATSQEPQSVLDDDWLSEGDAEVLDIESLHVSQLLQPLKTDPATRGSDSEP